MDFKLIFTIFALFCIAGTVQAEVTCLSTTTSDGYNGTCTGQYCFNANDEIRGCVTFYRMLRDDNLGCGNILQNRYYACICTQAMCNKYKVKQMPKQSLPEVNCTVLQTNGTVGYCMHGPCYAGNDFSDISENLAVKKDCSPNWYQAIKFNGQVIVYESPPLQNHPACFSDDVSGRFNCFCREDACNHNDQPIKPSDQADKHYQCYQMTCSAPSGSSACDNAPTTPGNQTCIGQMCYYAETIESNKKSYARGCLNYSYADPINELAFATGYEFGKTKNRFYPCSADLCNSQM